MVLNQTHVTLKMSYNGSLVDLISVSNTLTTTWWHLKLTLIGTVIRGWATTSSTFGSQPLLSYDTYYDRISYSVGYSGFGANNERRWLELPFWRPLSSIHFSGNTGTKVYEGTRHTSASVDGMIAAKVWTTQTTDYPFALFIRLGTGSNCVAESSFCSGYVLTVRNDFNTSLWISP